MASRAAASVWATLHPSVDTTWPSETSPWDDDWTFSIVLEWTPCNYGGTRPWFLCPAEGCGRRVAIVYLDGIFACRKCYDLRYVTQRVPAHYRRIFSAQAIRARLGGSPNLSLPLPNKPKGMHWQTYDRLCKKAYEFETGAWPSWLRKRAVANWTTECGFTVQTRDS